MNRIHLNNGSIFTKSWSILANPHMILISSAMDAADLISLVEHLEDNIDELEENLEPLLSAALTATTQKLPVLDKAKLYVLIVYSIESLLFCEFESRFHSTSSSNQPQHIYDSMESKQKTIQFSGS